MSKKSKRKEPPFGELILPGMIDSHFHTVKMRERGLDPYELLQRALDAGLAGGIDIGIAAGDAAERAWVLDLKPQDNSAGTGSAPSNASTSSSPSPSAPVLLSAGLAPAEAEHENLEARIELLQKDLDAFPVSALGEIGVDGYWNYGTEERQRELFARQIEIANHRGLPIIIHNRDADDLLLDLLAAHPPQHGGIMHCYSSGYETAKKCINFGLLISFAGNVTFKKSEELRDVARKVPADSVLVETDSPFLGPEPFRGKPNHPAKVAYVYELLAESRETDVEELIAAVGKNFNRFFGRLPE